MAPPFTNEEREKEFKRFGITEGDFERFLMRPSNVPCAGCTQCCRNNEYVFLHADENLDKYAHDMVVMPNGRIRPALKHKENGDCVYLTEAGCGIYENRPQVCRHYDCRVDFITGGFDSGGTQGIARMKEGEKRVSTLPSVRRKIANFLREHREKLLKYLQSN